MPREGSAGAVGEREALRRDVALDVPEWCRSLSGAVAGTRGRDRQGLVPDPRRRRPRRRRIPPRLLGSVGLSPRARATPRVPRSLSRVVEPIPRTEVHRLPDALGLLEAHHWSRSPVTPAARAWSTPRGQLGQQAHGVLLAFDGTAGANQCPVRILRIQSTWPRDAAGLAAIEPSPRHPRKSSGTGAEGREG